jgi:MarR family transcriptional regulator, 2-MHQ and catechol-resistance regulon repressor
MLCLGPLPVNGIGGLIDLTTGSITTAVDRMETKWLVVRKNHPTTAVPALSTSPPRGVG